MLRAPSGTVLEGKESRCVMRRLFIVAATAFLLQACKLTPETGVGVLADTPTGSGGTGSGGAAGAGGSSGSTSTSPFSGEGCFFGPENGSPVLRQELQLVGDQLQLRACKCAGIFQNHLVDLRLTAYEPITKVKSLVAQQLAVSANGACTDPVSVPLAQIPNAQWLEIYLTSASGQMFDDCAYDGCLDADNTYRTGALFFNAPLP